MNYQRRVAFLIALAAYAILSIGCRLATTQVSTLIPTDVPRASFTIVPSPIETPILLSSPTVVPAPAYTESPVPSQTSVPISGPFRLIIPVDEVLSGTFESLDRTTDGTLWLITDQGIARLVDTTWTAYLTSVPGKIAEIDSTGRVWVVNADGTEISAWDGQAWITYSMDAGWEPLAGDYNQYMDGGQSDLQGRIWFATSQDVRAFDGNRWTVYTPREMGMGPHVYEDLMTSFEVTISRSGSVWVSECDWGGPGPFGGRGIRWFNEGVWRGASSPVASGCATVLAEDGNGRVWAGLDDGLWRYEPAPDAWSEFTSPESPNTGVRFGFIDSLVVDSQDTAWPRFVTCGGASCYIDSILYHFQDGQWSQVGEGAEFDSNYWGPVFDAAGMIWLRWDGGIYLIKANVPELVSPLAGRFGTIDHNGRLWFVARYDGRETLWVLDDGARQ